MAVEGLVEGMARKEVVIVGALPKNATDLMLLTIALGPSGCDYALHKLIGLHNARAQLESS